MQQKAGYMTDAGLDVTDFSLPTLKHEMYGSMGRHATRLSSPIIKLPLCEWGLTAKPRAIF